MLRRIAIALPILFALGCGAAPPPAAAPPPTDAPPAQAAQASGASAAAAAAASAAPAAPHAPAATDSGQAGKAPIGKAAVSPTDAPLVSTITQGEVLAQVSNHADLFNKCYSLGAGASKTWRAKVTIKATVGPTGQVGSADVTNSTAKNPKVDACVVEAFKKLSFPRPKGSGTTTFTFPLSFDGAEQVQ